MFWSKKKMNVILSSHCQFWRCVQKNKFVDFSQFCSQYFDNICFRIVEMISKNNRDFFDFIYVIIFCKYDEFKKRFVAKFSTIFAESKCWRFRDFRFFSQHSKTVWRAKKADRQTFSDDEAAEKTNKKAEKRKTKIVEFIEAKIQINYDNSLNILRFVFISQYWWQVFFISWCQMLSAIKIQIHKYALKNWNIKIKNNCDFFKNDARLFINLFDDETAKTEELNWRSKCKIANYVN